MISNFTFARIRKPDTSFYLGSFSRNANASIEQGAGNCHTKALNLAPTNRDGTRGPRVINLSITSPFAGIRKHKHRIGHSKGNELNTDSKN